MQRLIEGGHTVFYHLYSQYLKKIESTLPTLNFFELSNIPMLGIPHRLGLAVHNHSHCEASSHQICDNHRLTPVSPFTLPGRLAKAKKHSVDTDTYLLIVTGTMGQ